jgi:hypothetical protein
VFNYEDEVVLMNGKGRMATEQSSSALLSVAREDSFDHTFESIEVNNMTNESFKDSFSVKNEEPRAKNVHNYNLKHEICFNKMKNQPIVIEDYEEELLNVSEKSSKQDVGSQLQANMQVFEKYHIGRNQNMKMTKSASIIQL